MPSESVRNLGIIFTSQMTMAEHVNTVTRNCFYQLRQLPFIRRSLSPDTAKLLIHAFISSRVNYCNSLLFGATANVARKLQAVLNASVRYISGLRRFKHILSVLKDELHWLPVEYCMRYKLAMLLYKCLHGAETYLAEPARHSLRQPCIISCVLWLMIAYSSLEQELTLALEALYHVVLRYGIHFLQLFVTSH